MQKEKDIWIQNVHTSAIQVEVTDKTGAVALSKTFYVFSQDRLGQVKHSGYTKITEDEYMQLIDGSPLFKKFVENNLIVRFDEAPVNALNPSEQLITLTGKVRKLEAENASLKAQIDAKETSDADTDAQVARIAELEAENSEQATRIAELEAENADLLDETDSSGDADDQADSSGDADDQADSSGDADDQADSSGDADASGSATVATDKAADKAAKRAADKAAKKKK